jgi:hypothetical protein
MAVEIKSPATQIDLENAINAWLDLLSEEKYLDAYTFTLHDPYYQWTPKLLEEVINGYGLPYENDGSAKCKVTKWTLAVKDNTRNYYKEFNFFDKPIPNHRTDFVEIGDIYYDLPIDGEWSDLTATFKILQSKTFTTLELNEIHVM